MFEEKNMPTLNLKEYYPTAHSKDFFVEVSEDIHQFFLDAKCKENAFVRQVSRYHAYYSLDDPDFVVEQYALFLTQTPADTVERKHYFRHIDREIQALSPKQTHRLYVYYYLGLSMQDIANKEAVSVGSVSECIKSALTALRERCNLFNF